MTTTLSPTTAAPAARGADPAAGLRAHVSVRETLSQTLSMAWRATKKMRRNPEQFFDVTIQPLLFTAMFAYIFGGAVSGDVKSYLPLVIPGILAQTALTACMATGVQLREDMDKGVFDRFKSLPIARVAPLAGPMVADLLRYAIAAMLTFAMGMVMGYRPGGGAVGVAAAIVLVIVVRLVAGLDLHLRRHARPQRPERAGHLDDDHVPAHVPVQRLRPVQHAAGRLRQFVDVNPVSHVVAAARVAGQRRAVHRPRSAGRCSAALVVVAVFAPLSVRAYTRKM